MMNITFEPLSESHFPLLFKWLETKHVKAWWDEEITWTLELIKEKYSRYVQGYKLHKEIAKEIYVYIIIVDNIPIGYIQYYNKYDFPPESNYDISELPESCGGLDWYIGEANFIGKGIGSQAMSLFLEQHVFQKFDYVLVDPDTRNIAAIRAYEKAGFTITKKVNNDEIMWMIKNKLSSIL